MDDDTDGGDTAGEDTDGGDAGGRGGERADEAAAGADRGTAAPDEPSAEPGRRVARRSGEPRWWERPRFWVVLIVVEVVVALVLASVAERADEVVLTDDQRSALCAGVDDLRSLRPDGSSLDVDEAGRLFREQQLALEALAGPQDGRLEEDLLTLAAEQQRLAEVADELAATGSGPDALAALVEELAASEQAVATESARVEAAVAEACGPGALAGTPEPSTPGGSATTAPPGSAPVGPVAPTTAPVGPVAPTTGG